MNDSLTREITPPIVQMKTKQTALRLTAFDTSISLCVTKLLARYHCRSFSMGPSNYFRISGTLTAFQPEEPGSNLVLGHPQVPAQGVVLSDGPGTIGAKFAVLNITHEHKPCLQNSFTRALGATRKTFLFH